MRKFTLIAAAAMTLTAGSGAALADGSEVRSLTATPIQVARVCETYQGYGLLNPGVSGQYGCYTRGGWVHCDVDGSCTGARYTRFEENAAGFERGSTIQSVLSGRTTQLVPRHDR